jgi:NADPH-dependent glutamate synthase beta subunit-like oxidoreductase
MNDDRPFAISVDAGTSARNRTGSWRTTRPVYVSRMPPCNHACPAGENIQAWLACVQEGRYLDAWEMILQENPFPAIHGRVCYHPCETACNRGQLDDAVSVHAVERFVGDMAIRAGWKVRTSGPTGKRVLVIGAGPSGLSCAYHLARRGHLVEVYESADQPGGMMRYGIPRYRLPRDILDAEIQRIIDIGVQIHLRRSVTELKPILDDGQFDAVFLATGAHLSKRVDIPARDARRVIDAIQFLRRAGEPRDAAGGPIRIGRRVAVYGGGNTALDAARTAKRLGAEETVIVYRRDRAHMPAHDSEVQEALEEGVTVNWLRTIKSVSEDRLTVEVMTLDEKGRPQPTGKLETIEADTLILALGQACDSAFLHGVHGLRFGPDGIVEVDAQMMTGYPGLFAGGDVVPAERTVTTAVGHGKKAARSIDAYVRGVEPPPREKPPLATFDRLNTWYYLNAERTRQPELERTRRERTFDEVLAGLDEPSARYESQRCLSCGNCFACDTCYAVCPDNAVVKVGPGKSYAFNLDYCKGCGLCAQECPCGAIEMVAEGL